MTIPQAILLQVESDLENFRVDYGYELDYPSIFKGYIPPSKNNNFPLVCFDIEGETSVQSGSTNKQQLKELQLVFEIYLDEKKESGKIMTMREQARADINKFVMGDTSISEGKTLDLFSAGAESWNLQTSHDTNYETGRCKLTALVSINYYENYTDTLNFQNVRANG